MLHANHPVICRVSKEEASSAMGEFKRKCEVKIKEQRDKQERDLAEKDIQLEELRKRIEEGREREKEELERINSNVRSVSST